jgi:hypothetical protein
MQDLPVAVDAQGITIRQADWGDMTVSLERFPAGLETAPLFRGLPDDRCQCPHWGYVVSGRIRLVYSDREEMVAAGDAYFLAPGHTTVFEEDTVVVEFSPRSEYEATMEVAGRNAAQLLGA